jgi:hypothetical protein
LRELKSKDISSDIMARTERHGQKGTARIRDRKAWTGAGTESDTGRNKNRSRDRR